MRHSSGDTGREEQFCWRNVARHGRCAFDAVGKEGDVRRADLEPVQPVGDLTGLRAVTVNGDRGEYGHAPAIGFGDRLLLHGQCRGIEQAGGNSPGLGGVGHAP